MLSYQHGYHAGNFADVLKHAALCSLLTYLAQKDKPLFYLETHAGKGLYDLTDRQAEKTGEYKLGVEPIWANKNKLPPSFAPYISILKKLNTQSALTRYPGSPYMAIELLRHIDRLYLCELHPREYDALSTLPHLNKRVHSSNQDGIEALNSLLPPIEKRGLIFVDPSYEVKDEYKTIPKAIKQSYSRFSTGVYCIWYPIINSHLCEQFIRRMQSIEAKNALRVEFLQNPALPSGMNGCGLWLINPPFTFAAEIESILSTLKKYFNPPRSSYIIETYQTK
jgi:23S rRNA (adenine2030-N6)-methyltransferase